MEIRLIYVLIYNMALGVVLVGAAGYLISKLMFGLRLSRIKKEFEKNNEPIDQDGLVNKSLQNFHRKYLIGFFVLNAALFSFFVFWLIIFYFDITMIP